MDVQPQVLYDDSVGAPGGQHDRRLIVVIGHVDFHAVLLHQVHHTAYAA